MAFFSNPFSSQLGQRIERATSDQLEAEDWALNIEICDMINETDEGPKDTMKALKKRIFNNKNYRQVMLALSVLETCVKNCGKRVHLQVAQKEFIADLGKLAGHKSNAPTIVKQKVLALIQTWSDSFKNQPDLANISMTHEYLRRQGVEFPPQDLDAMAPIFTPERTVPEEPAAPSSSSASQRYQDSPVQLRQAPAPAQPQPQPHQHPVPPNEYTGTASITPTSEQLGKIRSEADIVVGNVRVLSEMLTALVPGQEDPSDWELLRDLNMTCRHMQSRIVELLSRIVSEELTGELLMCNDELNNVFTRYDRYEKNRAAAVQTQPSQAANQAFETPSSYPPTETPSVPAASAPAPAPAPASAPAPIGSLIDFSFDQPPTTTSAATIPSDPPPSYSELGEDLAGLSLESAGGPPPAQATQAPMSAANPFASSPVPPEAGEQRDDFDMFAQSRQSFDTAVQGIGSRTRGYTVEDSHASVAGAINARSAFPGAPTSEAGGLQSMEEWLVATDLQSQPQENIASGTQETMTTSEFDQFLEERVVKLSSTGENASSGAAAPLNQSAQARRVRPQMQKEEAGPEDDLFAL